MNIRLVFVLGCIISCFVLAEEKTTIEMKQNDYCSTEYWQSYYHDSYDIMTSPASFTTSDYLLLSGLIGTTALIYHFDEDVYDSIQDRKNNGSKKLMVFLKLFTFYARINRPL